MRTILELSQCFSCPRNTFSQVNTFAPRDRTVQTYFKNALAALTDSFVRASPRVIRSAICGLLCFFVSMAISPSRLLAETTGPTKGTLVIVGGGDKDHLVFDHFVKLAGGVNARLVVIPTASSTSPDYDYANHYAAVYAREGLKMPHVTVVHTHDRTEADEESLSKPIREADAVWFSGGRQWRIADAYLDTLVERELHAVLERGGVIGGSSAGASIQGSFLVRGDTKGSNILIGDHQRGLGYITNSAIDQHVIPRNRQGGLIEVLTDPDSKMDSGIDRESLLGIGIDEATGIVVRGNEFEVVGKEDGVVLLYNPKTWTPETADNEKYLTLRNGAKYNLKDRVVLDRGKPPRTTTARRPEGYYKDIFMDGGVRLSSKKRLLAAESLGLSYEHYADKD
ncbi:MAG: cyanophycinase [Planctomicrobium sp.]|jgi:cyanophycinase|nr:cyanophycinase [Planctomicrobium sp.]